MNERAAVAEFLGLPASSSAEQVLQVALEAIPVFACDRPWNVVACRHGRERDVAGELIEAGWVIYLPREVNWRGSGRRRRRAEQPLFGRYVFASCLPEGDVASTADMRHVVAVRRRQDGGSVVKPRVMRALMASHAAGAFDYTISKAKRSAAGKFAVDQNVRIVDGVLSGWDARILQVLSKTEVEIQTAIFGRVMNATIETSKLEAIS